MTNYLALALAVGLLYLVFRTVNRKLVDPTSEKWKFFEVDNKEPFILSNRNFHSKYFGQRRYTKAPAIH